MSSQWMFKTEFKVELYNGNKRKQRTWTITVNVWSGHHASIKSDDGWINFSTVWTVHNGRIVLHKVNDLIDVAVERYVNEAYSHWLAGKVLE